MVIGIILSHGLDIEDIVLISWQVGDTVAYQELIINPDYMHGQQMDTVTHGEVGMNY
jgi:hypothetical protein